MKIILQMTMMILIKIITIISLIIDENDVHVTRMNWEVKKESELFFNEELKAELFP